MVKLNKVTDVTEMYKKLSPEKKVFVLGIMQGILIEHPEHGEKKESEKVS